MCDIRLNTFQRNKIIIVLIAVTLIHSNNFINSLFQHIDIIVFVLFIDSFMSNTYAIYTFAFPTFSSVGIEKIVISISVISICVKCFAKERF